MEHCLARSIWLTYDFVPSCAVLYMEEMQVNSAADQGRRLDYGQVLLHHDRSSFARAPDDACAELRGPVHAPLLHMHVQRVLLEGADRELLAVLHLSGRVGARDASRRLGVPCVERRMARRHIHHSLHDDAEQGRRSHSIRDGQECARRPTE